MRLPFCVTAALLLAANGALSADFLFADDFEEDDLAEKWSMLSNWEVKEDDDGNHFAEKLNDAGQVDLEILDMTFDGPFTVQMRIKQVNADAGAHIAVHAVRAPFEGYIYGFNISAGVEWNTTVGEKELFDWDVGADTWVTYKILAKDKSAKCYYKIEGEKDFTLSHDKDDVGIEHKNVFIGLWVGTVVQVDDVYVWAGVDRTLEEVFAVQPQGKLAGLWGAIKGAGL